MSRIRLLGPRDELQSVLERIQDLGLVHFVESAESEALTQLVLTTEQQRHVRNVRRVAEDVDVAISLLGRPPTHSRRAAESLSLPGAALIAGRARRALEALEDRRRQLEEERSLILKFRPFFSTFDKIATSGLDLDGIRIFYLVLRVGGEQELRRLRGALRSALGNGFELFTQPSESGEAAMILAVSSADAAKAEALLSEAGVQPLTLPDQFREEGAIHTIQRMGARLKALPRDLADIEVERDRIGAERGRDLARIQASLHDHLATIMTMEKAVVTPRAFVFEGWIPTAAIPDLERRLDKSFGGKVEVEMISKEEWEGEMAPVVLKNPRLFRPFEAITRMMPLPRYGSVDPTPFVAVFFPMFFGIALGDIG